MDEAWIQQSLARLEQLEGYKAQVQASGQAVDLSEVDAEIAALYEVLESAAGEGGEATPPQPAAPPFAAASPFEQQPTYAPPMSPAMHSPAPVMAPSYDASSSYADASYAGASYAGASYAGASYAGASYAGASYAGASSSYIADYDDPPKSKAPFIAVGALLFFGLGTGGWYIAGRGGPEPPPAAPTGDAAVINASAIPTDTQEPQVAKGGDAQRTEGFKIKESNRSAHRGNHDRRPAPRADDDRSSPKKPGKDGRKVTTIDDSRDPLAGAR